MDNYEQEREMEERFDSWCMTWDVSHMSIRDAFEAGYMAAIAANTPEMGMED